MAVKPQTIHDLKFCLNYNYKVDALAIHELVNSLGTEEDRQTVRQMVLANPSYLIVAENPVEHVAGQASLLSLIAKGRPILQSALAHWPHTSTISDLQETYPWLFITDPAPLVKESDPEFEKLLDEEEAIEKQAAEKSGRSSAEKIAAKKIEWVSPDDFKPDFTSDDDDDEDDDDENCLFHCESCDDAVTETEWGYCSQCRLCESCHEEHVSCDDCGYHAHADYMLYSDAHGGYYCQDCYVEPEECGELGKIAVAPWETRGHTVEFREETVGSENAAAREWGIDLQWDPVQAFCDFYLQEVTAQGALFGLNRREFTPELRNLCAEAKELFAATVAKCDHEFRLYVDMVVGGEVRYHRAVGGKSLRAGEGTRHLAWAGWKKLREIVGVEALDDAAILFSDISSGNVGGEKWAHAARLIAARYRGELDPVTFVDRVFNAQHNGGSLLNKVSWNQDNKGGWHVGNISTGLGAGMSLGDCHAANPPVWGPLLFGASDETRDLWRRIWREGNKARRSVGKTMLQTPTCYDEMLRQPIEGSPTFRWRRHQDGIDVSVDSHRAVLLFNEAKMDGWWVDPLTKKAQELIHPEAIAITEGDRFVDLNTYTCRNCRASGKQNSESGTAFKRVVTVRLPDNTYVYMGKEPDENWYADKTLFSDHGSAWIDMCRHCSQTSLF